MRWRVRTSMAVVAAIACLLGLALGMQRCGETFRELSCYHEQAAEQFHWEGGQYDDNPEPGQNHRDIASRGEENWRAFEADDYHSNMADKYAYASKRPWLRVEANPPAPAGAYPKFVFDPSAELRTPTEPFGSGGGFR